MAALQATAAQHRPEWGMMMPPCPHAVSKIASLALVTYTYNDHDLVDDLLSSVRCWSVRPKEIIVVDDGSRCRFTDKNQLQALTILRHDRNRGPTLAKAAGIRAVTSKFFLSVDADVRLPPQWAEACLPHVAEREIGMVSSRVRHETGSPAMDTYLDGLYAPKQEVGLVRFIPGPVFAMRKDTYDLVGGFAGHAAPRGEDTYLCQQLLRHGLRLYKMDGVEACQQRKLTLVQCMKRCVSWDLPYFEKRSAKGDSLVDTLPAFFMKCRQRMAFLPPDDAVVRYIGILFLVSGSLTIAGLNPAEPEGPRYVWRSFADYFSPFPHILGALARDIARIGLTSPVMAGEGCFFAGIDALLDMLFERRALSAMDQALRTATVDETAHPHYSMYMEE